MIRFNHSKGGATLKGLIAGGFLAGALGVAISQTGTPYGSGSNTGSPEDKTMSTPQSPSQPSGQVNQDTSQAQTGSQAKTGSASSTIGAASTAMNTGWRIRVCSEKTKAESINFTLSSSGASAKLGAGITPSASPTPSTSTPDVSATGAPPAGSTEPGMAPSGITEPGAASASAPMGPETASWTRGESTEISLPASLSNADKIRVEAVPGEKNKKASVCLLYNDHVAKKLNFDDREVSTVKKTQTGECGC